MGLNSSWRDGGHFWAGLASASRDNVLAWYGNVPEVTRRGQGEDALSSADVGTCACACEPLASSALIYLHPSAALEDTPIGLDVFVVAHVQPRIIQVERAGVFC